MCIQRAFLPSYSILMHTVHLNTVFTLILHLVSHSPHSFHGLSTSSFNKEAKDEVQVAHPKTHPLDYLKLQHNNEPVMKSITPNKNTRLLGCQNQYRHWNQWRGKSILPSSGLKYIFWATSLLLVHDKLKQSSYIIQEVTHTNWCALFLHERWKSRKGQFRKMCTHNLHRNEDHGQMIVRHYTRLNEEITCRVKSNYWC